MSSNEFSDPKSAALTSYERSLVTKLSDNPMELFAGRTVGWLEDFIRITVGIGPGNPSGGLVSGGRHVTGHYAWIAKDLTAFGSTEYVYEDASGEYLYCNGAAVNQIQYADLYAYYGPNAFGTDTATHFYLPDARGRAAFFCGTHANATLGDSDGIAVTSRQVNHQHAASITTVTVTGTASGATAGTPAGTLSAVSAGTPTGTLTAVSAGTPAGTLDGVSAGTPAGSVTSTDSGHAHETNDVQGVSPVSSTGSVGFTGGDRADAVIQFTDNGVAVITSTFTGTPLGTHGHTFTGAALGNHNHTFTGDALGTHGHTFTGTQMANHTHPVSASGSGSGTAGSGMSADGPAHIFLGSLVVRF